MYAGDVGLETSNRKSLSCPAMKNTNDGTTWDVCRGCGATNLKQKKFVVSHHEKYQRWDNMGCVQGMWSYKPQTEKVCHVPPWKIPTMRQHGMCAGDVELQTSNRKSLSCPTMNNTNDETTWDVCRGCGATNLKQKKVVVSHHEQYRWDNMGCMQVMWGKKPQTGKVCRVPPWKISTMG